MNARLADGYAHLFTTEPSVSQIDPNGPAAGKLRDGDILISVDGLLSTTREGGRRLANLPPGQPVDVLIWRGAARTEVRLTPVLGCETPSLAVLAEAGRDESGKSFRKGPARTRVAPEIDFGMILECGDCGWYVLPGRTRRWYANKSPVVVAVTANGPADRAGVAVGDVLDGLGRASLEAPRGSSEIAAIRANESVDLAIRRRGKKIRLQIIPHLISGPIPHRDTLL